MTKCSHNVWAMVFISILIIAGPILAQEPGRAAPQNKINSPQTAPGKAATGTHRFWDGENIVLFAGVATVRALDFTSTQHFRERGVNEVLLTNSIVDNKPLFATIEIAGTAASLGVSYWLHRTGHHQLERWVSFVHIGVATFGDIRNYGLSNPQFTGTTH